MEINLVYATLFCMVVFIPAWSVRCCVRSASDMAQTEALRRKATGGRPTGKRRVFFRHCARWIHLRRGTAVPLEFAYRTFLHVGTVTRRIDLLLPSGGFWSANAYEARHSLWRGGVMMGSGIDVAAAPDGPDALDPAPRRLAVEIHPTWDLRHPVWESRIFDIQALARLPARFSF